MPLARIALARETTILSKSPVTAPDARCQPKVEMSGLAPSKRCRVSRGRRSPAACLDRCAECSPFAERAQRLELDFVARELVFLNVLEDLPEVLVVVDVLL